MNQSLPKVPVTAKIPYELYALMVAYTGSESIAREANRAKHHKDAVAKLNNEVNSRKLSFAEAKTRAEEVNRLLKPSPCTVNELIVAALTQFLKEQGNAE